jgi:hypothetical protein
MRTSAPLNLDESRIEQACNTPRHSDRDRDTALQLYRLAQNTKGIQRNNRLESVADILCKGMRA